MSGPKVIDIKALRRRQRRESLVLLRQLGLTLDACLALQPKAETLFRQNTATLLNELEAMKEAEEWGGLLDKLTGYTNFYNHEMECLRAKEIQERAFQLRKAMREARPKEAARPYTTISAPQASSKLAAAAQSFLQATSTTPPPQPAPSVEEIRLSRCLELIAELSLTQEAEALQWQVKAQNLHSDATPQRAMRLDSLILEVNEHLQTARNQESLQSKATALLAELQGCEGAEAEQLRQELSSSPQASTLTTARCWLDAENARQDAAEQRAAVLQGLQNLGYEVREGMATAWAQDGKIILHKPSESTYGVEFASPATGHAMQARVIAAGASSGKQRDKEMEDTWCSEFARLREFLATSGFTTSITLAKESGIVPVKSVPATRVRSTVTEKPAERYLAQP